MHGMAGDPGRARGKRAIHGTIGNVVYLIANISFYFLVPPLLIGYFGRNIYSNWVFVLSFGITGFLSFLDLGFLQAGAKYIANSESPHETASAIKAIYLVIALLATFVVLLFANTDMLLLFKIDTTSEDEVRLLLNILSIRVFVEFFSMAYVAILKGIERFELVRAADISRLILECAGYFVAAWLNADVVWFVFVHISAYFVRILVLRQACSGIDGHIVLNNHIAKIIGFAIKMVPIKFGSFVWNNVDKLVISILLTTSLLTDYDIIYKINLLLMSTLYLATATLLPSASNMTKSGESGKLKQLFLLGTKYTMFFSVPPVIILFVMAESFLSAWVGERFAALADISRLLLAHMLFTSLIPAGQEIFYGMEKQTTIGKIVMFSGGANLVLSVALGVIYGMWGVIFATFVTALFGGVAHILTFMRAFHLGFVEFFKEVLLKIYVPGSAMFAFLMLISAYRKPAGLIEVLFYACLGFSVFVLLFFSMGMSDYEKEMIKGFWGRKNAQ